LVDTESINTNARDAEIKERERKTDFSAMGPFIRR
jgi:hypothetical protein